jgi:hypothetical protein
VQCTDEKEGSEGLRAYGLAYLGNVFRFEKVIHIEENLDGDSKLEKVVDNFLNPVGWLHLVCWECPLLLSKWSGAALEYHLLDNSGGNF